MSRVAWGRVLLAVVFVGIWQLASSTFASFVLPSPASSLAALGKSISDGWLLPATAVTLGETLAGFALAVVVGLFFGFLFGVARFWGAVWEPFIAGTYGIPKITIYPIFLLLFKIGSMSKIFFGFFHGVFPIQIMSQSATRNLKPIYLKVARTMRLSRRQTILHVIVPAILPSLIAGLRLGFSLTFIGVVVGEMIAGRAGLGVMLRAADATFDMKRTMVVVIVLAVLAVGINQLFLLWERRVSPKHTAREVVPVL